MLPRDETAAEAHDGLGTKQDLGDGRPSCLPRKPLLWSCRGSALSHEKTETRVLHHKEQDAANTLKELGRAPRIPAGITVLAKAFISALETLSTKSSFTIDF